MRGQESGRRRKVAEYNPSPRWPQGYFQVLEEMGVEERRRGFYAHWVRQFFNRCKGRVLNKGPLGVVSPFDTL